MAAHLRKLHLEEGQKAVGHPRELRVANGEYSRDSRLTLQKLDDAEHIGATKLFNSRLAIDIAQTAAEHNKKRVGDIAGSIKCVA